eukprot:g435.t1
MKGIKKALEEEKGEMDAMFPFDEEVEVYEKKKAKRAAIFRCVTQWGKAPRLIRWIIGCGALSMALGCDLVILLPGRCLRPFEVKDRIGGKLTDGGLGGNVLNIVVRPIGLVATALLALSCLCLGIFYVWARRKIKEFMDDEGEFTENADAVLVANGIDLAAFDPPRRLSRSFSNPLEYEVSNPLPLTQQSGGSETSGTELVVAGSQSARI